MRRRDLRAVLVMSMGALATGCAAGAAQADIERVPAEAAARMSTAPANSADAGGAASTTVIVVRHAEKATGQGDDPQLSDAGMARARVLAQALTSAGVTGVIVTNYVRTAETAAPTARAAGVTPEVVRVPTDRDWLQRHLAEISAAVRGHAGGVVLIVGHSNTVSEIVAALGGERPRDICDSEYDRMEIVNLLPSGQVQRIQSRYGAPTPVDAECASMR